MKKRYDKSDVFWGLQFGIGGDLIFGSIFRFWQSHMFQPQLAMQRFIYCVHICDTQTYYSGISVSEPKASTHTHTRAANIHTTHKGKMILPMGACPHRYYRRSPLCVVRMLAARVCVLALGSLTLIPE